MIISPFKTYKGSKAVNGLREGIINLMPPHDVYIEPFLGGGEILCKKKAAVLNVGNDCDRSVFDRWQPLTNKSFVFFNEDYRAVVDRFICGDRPTLIYFDPPYLKRSRKSLRDIYRHEFTESDHEVFIDYVTGLNAMVIISGYKSDLYSEKLKGWNTKILQGITHRGKITEEILWYNFPEPVVRHDYAAAGDNHLDRQRIKRKVSRWVNKFAALPALEKHLIYKSITERFK